MKFKGVIFDLDGTLVNSLEDIADSMNRVLGEYGFPTHDLEAYKRFVGRGLRNLVSRALPKDKDEGRSPGAATRCWRSTARLSEQDTAIRRIRICLTSLFDGTEARGVFQQKR